MSKNIVRTAVLALAGCAMAAVSAAPLHAQSKGDSKPEITVGGLSYLQYGYQLKDPNDQNDFDVTRAYIDIKAKFDNGVGARITPDIYRDANGSLNYRLKYAYLSWTPENSPVTLELGQIHTPWLDWEEHLWGYRMQGTMALDRNHYLTSSDLGFGINGSFQQHLFDFQWGVYNGEGYHGGVGDKHKDTEARASVRLLQTDDMGARGGLRLTAYGQVGAPTDGGKRNRAVGMLSYKSRMFTLAGEFAATADSTSSSTTKLVGRVFSGYGVVNVPRADVAFIARVDVVNPNKDVSGDRQTRYIAGVAYKLNANAKLLFDWDYVDFESSPSPSALANSSTAYVQAEFSF